MYKHWVSRTHINNSLRETIHEATEQVKTQLEVPHLPLNLQGHAAKLQHSDRQPGLFWRIRVVTRYLIKTRKWDSNKDKSLKMADLEEKKSWGLKGWGLWRWSSCCHLPSLTTPPHQSTLNIPQGQSCGAEPRPWLCQTEIQTLRMAAQKAPLFTILSTAEENGTSTGSN